MSEIDPWEIIYKLRFQHRDEVHNVWMKLCDAQSANIEALERELSEERALSADLARAVDLYCPWEHSSLKAYREARGL